MSAAEKFDSIKLLPFNGKTERWRPWKKKFLVQSSRKGYKGVLLGDDVILQNAAINLLSGQAKTDAEAERKRLVALNDLAYEDLILSMDDKTTEGKVVFNIIDMVYIGIYVDDCLLVGDKKAIDWTIQELKKEFNLKEAGDLDDYLSCEVRFNKSKTKAWIGQPHMIAKIRKKFNDIVTKLPEYATPGTPRKILMKEEKTMVSKENETMYRSGVGQLLYLVKHSCPDIANAVRELSKGLDGINLASVKELMRVVKFVLNTANLGLKIEPIIEKGGVLKWRVVAFSDSDYATDPKSRISISGFVLYFMGVPVSWRSKAQRSVTLSSSEAEFVALSECAKEVKFLYQLLLSMGIKVEMPVTIRVDNIGAIFMSNNVAISQKTKHIDTRVKWFVELIVDDKLKIVFVKSELNDADLYTKNLGRELYDTHSNKMIWRPIDMMK